MHQCPAPNGVRTACTSRVRVSGQLASRRRTDAGVQGELTTVSPVQRPSRRPNRIHSSLRNTPVSLPILDAANLSLLAPALYLQRRAKSDPPGGFEARVSMMRGLFLQRGFQSAGLPSRSWHYMPGSSLRLLRMHCRSAIDQHTHQQHALSQ